MLRRVTVLLALLLPLLVFAGPPANAGSESEFVSRTNGARVSRGIRAYAVRSDLTAVARRQAARMAASGQIYHNARLGSEVGGWQSIGENVGRGGSVSAIHDAFMGSYSHRANILSTTFTEVGIGTARSGSGELFVSEVFRRPSGAATYVPPVPRPQPVYRAPARASRSSVRRPIAAAPRPPARTRVVVDRFPRQMRTAKVIWRSTTPVRSLDRAIVFVRVNKVLSLVRPRTSRVT